METVADLADGCRSGRLCTMCVRLEYYCVFSEHLRAVRTRSSIARKVARAARGYRATLNGRMYRAWAKGLRKCQRMERMERTCSNLISPTTISPQ
ncbi:hypothetical protein DPMN_027179 [Dreissena polymorpha]|uniref:Uncharacterized protein n=1 Tax=Dreissena polymorpha TaxID=45954 RepID=A0A9D4RDE1_DREPO|nr:hypothetical protein DPMN_027179 [Dreissena polymorpha]